MNRLSPWISNSFFSVPFTDFSLSHRLIMSSISTPYVFGLRSCCPRSLPGRIRSLPVTSTTPFDRVFVPRNFCIVTGALVIPFYFLPLPQTQHVQNQGLLYIPNSFIGTNRHWSSLSHRIVKFLLSICHASPHRPMIYASVYLKSFGSRAVQRRRHICILTPKSK